MRTTCVLAFFLMMRFKQQILPLYCFCTALLITLIKYSSVSINILYFLYSKFFLCFTRENIKTKCPKEKRKKDNEKRVFHKSIRFHSKYNRLYTLSIDLFRVINNIKALN
jgi:hypothetical protein